MSMKKEVILGLVCLAAEKKTVQQTEKQNRNENEC